MCPVLEVCQSCMDRSSLFYLGTLSTFVFSTLCTDSVSILEFANSHRPSSVADLLPNNEVRSSWFLNLRDIKRLVECSKNSSETILGLMLDVGLTFMSFEIELGQLKYFLVVFALQM